MTHVGFTGTRSGMTPDQCLIVDLQLGQINGPFVAHHGDCVGADSQFHQICRGNKYPVIIVGHIPTNDSDRAFCVFDEVRAPVPYMKRNRQIVFCSDFMIAAPFETTEQERGGTWRTIGLTRKAKKPLLIVWPNGRLTRERT